MHTHRRTAVLALLLMISLLAGFGGPGAPIRAQDDDPPDHPLTEEQLAWLDRAHEAIQNLRAATNYTSTSAGTYSVHLTLRLGDDMLTGSEFQSWKRTQTTFPGDPDTIAGMVMSEQMTREFGTSEDEAIHYRLSAEVRWIDGVLYVQATPIDPGPDTPDIPAGWIIVEDPEEYPALSSLNLNDFIDESSIFDNLDAMRAAALDVTWEAVTLDDGSPADQITIIFGLEALFNEVYDLSDEEVAQWEMLFASSTDEEFVIQVTMIVGADGLPISYTGTLTCRLLGIDATDFFSDSVPEGTTLDWENETTVESTITAVNTPADPITVPEALAGVSSQD